MVQHGNSFVSSGFFVLRTPLLPFTELLNSGNDFRRHLAAVFARPEVAEALFIASPSLHGRLPVWRRDPQSDRGQRIEQSLVRYFLRMVGRVAPFGLFAGSSVGEVGSRTHLELEAHSHYQRHTRLDMDYVCDLCECLGQDPALRDSLVYGPNSSVYCAAGRVRYIESHTATNLRLHNLVAVESNPQLESALSLAADGVLPSELAASLSASTGLSHTEAKEFVSELIDSSLLVSELTPLITGREPVNDLIATLEGRSQTHELATRLAQIKTSLEQLDVNGLGNSPASYQTIADSVRDLPAPFDPEKLFQVDLIKTSPHATLGAQQINEILRGVKILRRFATVPSSDLSLFRDVFLERYGEDNKVALVEALDPDVGIGFNSLRQPVTSQPLQGWDRFDTYLLRKLEHALANGLQAIAIEERELDDLEQRNQLPLPDAFAVSVSLGAASEGDLAKGNVCVSINNISGPSGARLLGRFSYLDEGLRHKVEAHLRAEETLNPDAVFAEIVHLPAGRTGNVLLRPVLRGYEIPYLGRSGQAKDKQIPVNDLYVTVSGRRVVLYSRSLGREIIPRLTASHYFPSSGPDVYRFLCTLQGQDLASELEWDWGPLSAASFLPRVTCGRLVLSRAEWNVAKSEWNALHTVPRQEQFRAFQTWRAERRLPRFVVIRTGLPFDLDNTFCVDALLALARQIEINSLVEFFPTPEQFTARGPEGRYVHELIVPFVRSKDSERVHEEEFSKPAERVTAQRTFPPGSEWLYVKLYAGNSTVDHLLRTVVYSLAQDAIAAGDTDHWFFIRYGDPHWHLRLRFHGSPEKLHHELMPKLNAATSRLLSDGKIWRVQVDTYQREIERYGGDEAIHLAEKIFHVDSESVLAILNSLPGNGGSELRRLFAVRSIDVLMADFGLTSEAREEVARRMRNQSLGESAADVELKHQWGRKFRRERKVLESMFEATGEAKELFAAPLRELDKRSELLRPLITELKTLGENGRLSIPVSDILPSIIHMHLNRFLSSARPIEMNLYDSLCRLYESRRMRKKGSRIFVDG